MRIRTILAAAAAPAALAAVLLGTAGQASAAVTQGPAAAVLAASVKTQTYQANTHQHRLADTTSVDTNLAGNATINNDGRAVRQHRAGLGVRQHGASAVRDRQRCRH